MILIYVWINAGTDSGSVDSSCLIRHQCAQCTMWSGVPVAGKIDKIVVTQRSGASLVEVGAMEGPEEIVMKYMDARIENRSEDVIALLSDHAEISSANPITGKTETGKMADGSMMGYLPRFLKADIFF